MKLNGAEITIKLLELQGIRTVSGIPGGFNLPLYNALFKSKITHILARHEQGCGFIAHGMARSTGKPAVCFATSGPGVTNLLTAIADAKLDSVPVVAITGQVSLSAIGTDAFQEIDTYGLTIPITKHNFLVRSVDELLYVIPESFKIATSGRPGPVVIDIPKDVQLAELEFHDEFDFGNNYFSFPKESINTADLKEVKLIADKIKEAKRPILYIGGGIVSSEAYNEVFELAKKNNIPVVSTLMGLGCFPPTDALYLGMLGMHGTRSTNKLMYEADLLLAFGVRLDDRAIGDSNEFCPEASIIHVDIDASEINKIKQSNMSIPADIRGVLETLIPLVDVNPRKEWMRHIEIMKKKYPFKVERKNHLYHPIEYIKIIQKTIGPEAIITTDVGQHQMWVAQAYEFAKPRKLLTSGGLGTMGFGLPAAIGAAIQNPHSKVVCISGDGSILMNIQELATLSDLNLNVKVIVMNNGHLGLVRQQQELFYEENYIACKFINNSNYALIAEGFGIKGYDLEGCNNQEEVLIKALNETGPCLINIPIHFSENVFPIVPPGKGNHEMIGGEYDE
jgi:acetolactate synthase I/II/III large subunit